MVPLTAEATLDVHDGLDCHRGHGVRYEMSPNLIVIMWINPLQEYSRAFHIASNNPSIHIDQFESIEF